MPPLAHFRSNVSQHSRDNKYCSQFCEIYRDIAKSLEYKLSKNNLRPLQGNNQKGQMSKLQAGNSFCVTCHDTTGTCKHRDVTRHARGPGCKQHGAVPSRNTVYEHMYLVPSAQSNPHRACETVRRSVPKQKPSPTINKQVPDYKKIQDFKKQLEKAPIGLDPKQPFLVSNPHWSFVKHTQRWPWKGELHCKLWAPGSGVKVSHTGLRKGCWERTLHPCLMNKSHKSSWR